MATLLLECSKMPFLRMLKSTFVDFSNEIQLRSVEALKLKLFLFVVNINL